METLSPKEAARVLGSSESSLKRWCDRGLIPVVRTSGGHRRLTLDALIRFAQQSGRPLAHPELAGTSAHTGAGERTLHSIREDLYAALLQGNEAACRQLLMDAYVAGVPLPRVLDEVVAVSFHRIGESYDCGDLEVFYERRAVETCLKVLHEFRQLVDAPPEDAPMAVGGTPACDPYSLPTTMIELVLRQQGWRATSLGARLPFETLVSAVNDLKPRLFWLSVSHIDDEPRFVREYNEFYAAVRENCPVVVGGRALTEPLRQQMQYAAFCDNLRHLEAFARSMFPAARKRRSKEKAARGK
jgi:MerR family transcriptional regulator, light-induced transcriptional regulator